MGYQACGDKIMSANTALTFCTTKFFLRTLMHQKGNLEKITHLIVDELHERDHLVGLLLGVTRSRLRQLPQLRIILMSAALDCTTFTNYFGDFPVENLKGTSFPVVEHFVEDILELTDYLSHSSPMDTDCKENKFKLSITEEVGSSGENPAVEIFQKHTSKKPENLLRIYKEFHDEDLINVINVDLLFNLLLYIESQNIVGKV